MPSEQSPEILDALKRSAAALRDADIEFALAGGLAARARGGPATEHDIDFLIREDDAAAALCALRAAGMRTDCPPEGWLVKAWCEDVLIDLIYAPRGVAVDAEFFARCEPLNVAAVEMLVVPIADLLVGKLLVLGEHDLDFGPPLEWARSLREQINWAAMGRRTEESPFARTFFHLLVKLQVLDGESELVVR
jgi:Aminoglycoside-2''-adenylyltransferase